MSSQLIAPAAHTHCLCRRCFKCVPSYHVQSSCLELLLNFLVFLLPTGTSASLSSPVCYVGNSLHVSVYEFLVVELPSQSSVDIQLKYTFGSR